MGGGRGQTDAQGGETGGGRWRRKKKKQRTKQTNAPGEESEEAGTKTATYGGRPGRHGPARDAGEVPDLEGMGAPKEKSPPPTAAKCLTPYLRCACVVPASCVLQREDDKGAPPPPHTTAPPGVGDDGSGTRTPPPEDKATGWGGNGERVQDGPHDRAQREHAPCKPQRRDHRGCDRGVGRATTGATRKAPPNLQRDKCRASCLHRARDVLTPEDTQPGSPPPPPPSPPPTQERGEDSEETARGHGGGQGTDRNAGGRDEWRAVEVKKKQRTPTRQSRGRQQGLTGHGRSQEAQQGARDRGTPLGKKAGGQGPTPQRTGGGRGDKSPQKTLVRFPTSGVWGPPRCPYRPHLTAGNKVGYARDRWPAARAGTGLGGWPMGLTKSTPHGTYCGSCPVRGCG